MTDSQLSLVDKNALKESESKAEQEIAYLKQEIEKLEVSNKNLHFNIGQKQSTISQHEDRLSELGGQLLNLEHSTAMLSDEVRKLTETNKVSQEQLFAARKRCEVLEGTVKVGALKFTIKHCKFDQYVFVLSIRLRFKSATQ
jgi:chromosome segregation ATPase